RAIVRTMKALATVSIRQYEDSVASLAEYVRGVNLGMQALLRLRPDALREMSAPLAVRPAAIVFGSDQGLCGAFNEQIAARFLERRRSAEAEASAAGAPGADAQTAEARLADAQTAEARLADAQTAGAPPADASSRTDGP